MRLFLILLMTLFGVNAFATTAYIAKCKASKLTDNPGTSFKTVKIPLGPITDPWPTNQIEIYKTDSYVYDFNYRNDLRDVSISKSEYSETNERLTHKLYIYHAAAEELTTLSFTDLYEGILIRCSRL
ncbi:MAG: hypothetical protein WBO32_02010 [Cyclobacteriaceae bacterium]